MKILITGAAGFIGSALAERLAVRGDEVLGLDNLNDYYDPRLKVGRLRRGGIEPPKGEFVYGEEVQSHHYPNLRFVRLNLHDREAMNTLFEREHFDKVMNLAAQAGVRYSLTNPMAYVESNLVGFSILLECCRHHGAKQLVFASSSSVYGTNDVVPYREDAITDTPVSLYAASKKANELMAHSYAKLYGIQTIGLRYFTVYGPWGRPDMAPVLFTRAILGGEPLKIFNNGDLSRDFTYIDDIVEGTLRTIDHTLTPEECQGGVPHRIYNIGCSNPVKLMDFIRCLEDSLGREAGKTYLPMQPGDVYQTYADTTRLQQAVGYKPTTPLADGIRRFAEWYQGPDNPLHIFE